MEQLIIWIVILAIGLGWEQLKKRSHRDEEAHGNRTPQREPEKNPWFQLLTDTNTDIYPSTPPPASTHEPRAARKAERKPKAKIKPVAEKAKPLPHEGTRVTSDLPQPVEETPPILAADPAEEATLAAHYDRWRRAIIDAEILRNV
ncbi:MAG: hypothetical protein NC339_04410 [Muribaculaceae bacterium]|nr:hypothetical protein [Muribaculaceae bacterium]